MESQQVTHPFLILNFCIFIVAQVKAFGWHSPESTRPFAFYGARRSVRQLSSKLRVEIFKPCSCKAAGIVKYRHMKILRKTVQIRLHYLGDLAAVQSLARASKLRSPKHAIQNSCILPESLGIATLGPGWHFCRTSASFFLSSEKIKSWPWTSSCWYSFVIFVFQSIIRLCPCRSWRENLVLCVWPRQRGRIDSSQLAIGHDKRIIFEAFVDKSRQKRHKQVN